MKKKVSINKRTGKLVVKKGTKACTICIKVTSKANKNRKACTKTVKLAVK